MVKEVVYIYIECGWFIVFNVIPYKCDLCVISLYFLAALQYYFVTTMKKN